MKWKEISILLFEMVLTLVVGWLEKLAMKVDKKYRIHMEGFE